MKGSDGSTSNGKSSIFGCMATTITAPNRKLIERLVKSGRFNNYSEVVRYGLELVRREIEREELSPYPESVLAKIYREMAKEEKDAEARLARASVRPSR